MHAKVRHNAIAAATNTDDAVASASDALRPGEAAGILEPTLHIATKPLSNVPNNCLEFNHHTISM